MPDLAAAAFPGRWSRKRLSMGDQWPQDKGTKTQGPKLRAPERTQRNPMSSNRYTGWTLSRRAEQYLAEEEKAAREGGYRVENTSVKAFEMAGINPADVDVAELHDAFTILEIAESEHAGFFEKGAGAKALAAGETQIGGRLPINPSGGLKARGHPVGATGAAQAVELVWQLRGEAEDRQVEGAEVGFALNFGGFGNNVVATVLRRE